MWPPSATELFGDFGGSRGTTRVCPLVVLVPCKKKFHHDRLSQVTSYISIGMFVVHA